MRSAIVAAAFAAGALAGPFAQKRALAAQGYGNVPQGYGDVSQGDGNVDVDYDVVYVTTVVTVTAGEEPPAYTPELKHYGHKHSKKPVTTTTIEEPAPAYTPPPTEQAPPPPAYEAPPAPAHEAPPAPAYEAPPASTPEAPPASSSGSSVPPPASGSYKDTCLYHHNLHRANHSAAALVWSDRLEATAKSIANKCVYAHDTEMDGGGYGQNIAAGVAAENISSVITDLFYNAEEPVFASDNCYGKPNPDMGNFEIWGHFSAMVWASTTEVGCATTHCPSLGNTGGGVSPDFTVCNYMTPGNYAGEYDKNVLPSKGHPSVSWDASQKASNSPTGYKK